MSPGHSAARPARRRLHRAVPRETQRTAGCTTGRSAGRPRSTPRASTRFRRPVSAAVASGAESGRGAAPGGLLPVVGWLHAAPSDWLVFGAARLLPPTASAKDAGVRRVVWARRRPPPAEGRRRREGSRPACVTGEQRRRVARRDRDSASRLVSVTGQLRGDRSRRRSCFTWNTPAERPRGRGPSVGEQLSLPSSVESASCHGSLWAAGLFRGESQRDSRGVPGRHAPGLGATARANSPRLTPAHQPGGRRSTTLRRCRVLAGHWTLFADAGQASARGAAPPPYGRRAPSPPRARPGASRGRVSRAAAVTGRTSVGGLVHEPARRATPAPVDGDSGALPPPDEAHFAAIRVALRSPRRPRRPLTVAPGDVIQASVLVRAPSEMR